jgi:hypothetical protein
MVHDPAEKATPAAGCDDGPWDPYEVWLSRIKQPRETAAMRSVRVKVVSATVTEAAGATGNQRPANLVPTRTKRLSWIK